MIGEIRQDTYSIGRYFKDRIIISIVVLAPTIGSVVTGLLLLLSIFYTISTFFIKRSKIPLVILTISFIYIVYICYFLLVGLINSGPQITLNSMAPNLPILSFALLGLFASWEKTKINSVLVGTFSTYGVLLTVGLSALIYALPPDTKILGLDLVEHTQAHKRLHLFCGNPLPFSTILVSLSFFGLLGYPKMNNFNRILSWVAIFSVGLVIVMWSQARGAQIVYLALLIFSGLFLKNYIKSLFLNLKFLSFIIFLSILAGVLGNINGFQGALKISDIALMRVYEGYVQAFSSNKELTNHSSEMHVADESVEIRKALYKAGIQIFFEKPIIGYGNAKMFSEAKLQSEELRLALDRISVKNYSHLHNSYLNHLVSGGIIGLMVFLGVLFLPIILIKFPSNSLNFENHFFAYLIFIYGLTAGLTNLYFNHDLLSTYHSALPFVLALSIIGDRNIP